MDKDKQFAVLREALWSGEIGEREFTLRCADLGIDYDRMIGTLHELRTEDGVEIFAVTMNGEPA